MTKSIIFSKRETCGVNIFARHLNSLLEKIDHRSSVVNVIHESINPSKHTNYIIHYVPSSLSNSEETQIFLNLLRTINDKIIIILHGFYSLEEKRFLEDTACPDTALHAIAILNYADKIVCLSESVRRSFLTWAHEEDIHKVIKIGHPGLYVGYKNKHGFKIGNDYVFIGGIERAKKNGRSLDILRLLKLCEYHGIKVRVHWSNAKIETKVDHPDNHTFGYIADEEWTELIANSKIVLCPYKTKIQSVSGIIPEAISAGTPILATSFDYSNEMRFSHPELVTVCDDIENWPNLILKKWKQDRQYKLSYKKVNWEDFANELSMMLQ
jgi:glycosyltransferase involved in cell wall biosynthesis